MIGSRGIFARIHERGVQYGAWKRLDLVLDDRHGRRFFNSHNTATVQVKSDSRRRCRNHRGHHHRKKRLEPR